VGLQSDATFDRFNLTTSYTSKSASASLKFNGTAIYFISLGIPSPDPATYQVTFDGQIEIHSLQLGDDDTMPQFMGYRRTGLDASKEHTITITSLESTNVNIDAFM
jgi:hypothetical protein